MMGLYKQVAAAMMIAGFVATANAAGIEVINDKAAFPEGPVFIDGKLLYVEYGGNTILSWDGTKTTKLWEQAGCGPSAVAPLGGDLAVTCYDSGTIARVSKDGKTLATYDKATNGSALQGPNDFASDGNDGLYFSASGPWEAEPIVGKVFYLSAEGEITEVANDLHYANGLVMTKDGSRLMVNESEAGRVISFAIGLDRGLSDRRLFVRVGVVDEASGIGAYPDGIQARAGRQFLHRPVFQGLHRRRGRGGQIRQGDRCAVSDRAEPRLCARRQIDLRDQRRRYGQRALLGQGLQGAAGLAMPRP